MLNLLKLFCDIFARVSVKSWLFIYIRKNDTLIRVSAEQKKGYSIIFLMFHADLIIFEKI